MGLFGIFLYLIAAYIRPQDFMLFMLGFPVVDVIAGATIFIGLLSLMSKKRPVALPQNYLIILFLLAIFLSNIINDHPDAAVEQFIFFLKRAAIFFMLLFIINSSQKLKWIINFIVLLTVFLVIQAVYQSIHGIGLAGQPLMPGYEDIRVTWIGMWNGPNVLCLLFVIALPFTLEFAFGPYSILWRLINLFFTAILSYGVYLTNSRGGFIAFLTIIPLYFWNRFKKIYIIIIILILILPARYFAPSRMSELSSEEESFHQRSWLWEQGLNMTRENPLFGVGKGQFKQRTYERLIAHNNFVQNMAEMGLVGLFLYVGIIYLSFKGLFVAQRALVKTKENVDILSIIRAIFISLIGFNIVTFFVNMEMDPLFIWLGLSAAAINIVRHKVNDISLKFSLKDIRNIFLIMIGIGFIIYLVAVKDIL